MDSDKLKGLFDGLLKGKETYANCMSDCAIQHQEREDSATGQDSDQDAANECMKNCGAQ